MSNGEKLAWATDVTLKAGGLFEYVSDDLASLLNQFPAACRSLTRSTIRIQ